jgi:hypothetical protein
MRSTGTVALKPKRSTTEKTRAAMPSVDYPRIVTAAIALGLLGVALPLAAWGMSRRNREVTVGPPIVLASWVLAALYLLGRVIDQLALWLSATEHPAGYSLIEALVFGRFSGVRALLPLADKPLVGAPLYIAVMLGLFISLIGITFWLGDVATLSGRYPPEGWRRIYALCGVDRALKQVEPRFTGWLRPLAMLASLLVAAAFFELFASGEAGPALSPTLWSVCAALTATLWVNLAASRRADVEEPEAEPQTETPEPPAAGATAWLTALETSGFEVASGASHVSGSVSPAFADTVALGDSAPIHELSEVLCAGQRLWSHQAEAAERVGHGEHVLLLSPPRSGKTTIARLLAADVALTQGQNALFVLRDRESVDEAVDGLAAQLARTSWGQNLRCTRVGPELVELLSQRRSPVLTFCDLRGLESLLSGHRDHATLLAYLGLIVVEDLERCSGVRAANLRLALSRLSLVLGELGCEPRVFATLSVPARDYERYAETVLGVDLGVVAANGAPSGAVEVYRALPPLDPPLPPAALALAEATRLELELTRLGFAGLTRTELERAAALVTRSRGDARTAPPELAEVSLAELSAGNLARWLALQHRLGAERALPAPTEEGEATPAAATVEGQDEAPAPEIVSPGGDDGDVVLAEGARARGAAHLQVLVPASDALSRWLVDDLRFAAELATRGRRLVAHADVPALRQRHLRAALAELPMLEPEARKLFGAAAIAELSQAGVLERRERMMLVEREPPRLEAVTELSRSRGAAEPTPASPDVVGPSLDVLDRATGALLRCLDVERAALVAYPGARILRRGRRFTVPLEPTPSYEAGGAIAAELCEEDLHTQRIRSAHTTVLEPERIKPLSLGGLEVYGALTAVRYHERILGVRRHRRDGSLAGNESFEPIELALESEARALLLPRGVELPTLRALTYVLRDCLPAICDLGEQGLVLTYAERIELRSGGAPLEEGSADAIDAGLPADVAGLFSAPVLLLVDTYPGGVGYARAADWAVLRDALGLALRLLESEREFWTPLRCHQRDPRQVEVDRAGARALCRQLLVG